MSEENVNMEVLEPEPEPVVEPEPEPVVESEPEPVVETHIEETNPDTGKQYSVDLLKGCLIKWLSGNISRRVFSDTLENNRVKKENDETLNKILEIMKLWFEGEKNNEVVSKLQNINNYNLKSKKEIEKNKLELVVNGFINFSLRKINSEEIKILLE